jgi:hypothetical protein
MTKDRLIEIASEGYPDGMIALYWDKTAQRVDMKTNHGDGLAKFIACELSYTYDPEATQDAQLGELVRVMNTAIRELTSVVRSAVAYIGRDENGKLKKLGKKRGRPKEVQPTDMIPQPIVKRKRGRPRKDQYESVHSPVVSPVRP